MRSFAALMSAVALSALVLSSCHQSKVETRPTIQYVRDILADRYSPEAQVLQQNQKPQRKASITLIGNEKNCISLSEAFLEIDARDNVDASFRPDGLPDFAGETVSVLMDGIPYGDMLEKEGEESFRAHAVKRALAALDTVLHISPYDLEGLSSKNGSKLIVLADPYLVQYGSFDIDTLFRSEGCNVKLISPMDLCAEIIMESFPDRIPNVAVVCDSAYVGKGVFESRYPSSLSLGCANGDSLVVRNILDRFLESGRIGTLDAIVVDDPDIDVNSVKAQIADLMSVMNEESVKYGRLISRDLVVLDASDVLISKCYEILRTDNLFTHNIAAPALESYRILPDPSSDASIMLIPAHVQK